MLMFILKALIVTIFVTVAYMYAVAFSIEYGMDALKEYVRILNGDEESE